MFLRAWAMALEIATGTSRALPKPKPTRPAPSPTTVSAVKPNWRPPLTTFAVRLTATSFSTSSSALCVFSILAMVALPSELESGFARGLGQCLHAAVVMKTRAVECHARDTGGLGALGNRAADRARRLDIAGALQPLRDLLLQRRSAGQHL